MALDSRLRGNDDLRAWEQAVVVLRHPQSAGTGCWSFATASLCMGMHTPLEKRLYNLTQCMGSHAGVREPEICDTHSIKGTSY
ncbi:hypothetical protein [Endozoicomonas sp. 8E]|uniref:hypothetical protein n=1 Tax=Endozoicomonas sp. 8E TaxID=3035692 RepID=UPI00293900F0|nr:hypothetical protein [Endozoicomonas sp. 8E]WOG25698.1 hypothetical protein P6910_14045 [Endozoicomonas sp. 8E]